MTSTNALLLAENSFPFHGFDEMAPHLEAAIGDAATVTATTDRDELLALADGEYDVFVDYTTDSTLTDGQQDALLGFVESGGGYLGIHCASDLTSVHDGEGGIDHQDEPIPALRELLGGHFVGHPEQGEFGVEVVGDHPVVDGVDDFTVSDEPYRIEYDADAITVLARMNHPSPDMDDYPVVWVREHGDGRVCYSSLGHTVEALENEAHRRVLRNGIRWVARE